jgi:hypothetical protein
MFVWPFLQVSGIFSDVSGDFDGSIPLAADTVGPKTHLTFCLQPCVLQGNSSFSM